MCVCMCVSVCVHLVVFAAIYVSVGLVMVALELIPVLSGFSSTYLTLSRHSPKPPPNTLV